MSKLARPFNVYEIETIGLRSVHIAPNDELARIAHLNHFGLSSMPVAPFIRVFFDADEAEDICLNPRCYHESMQGTLHNTSSVMWRYQFKDFKSQDDLFVPEVEQ